MRKTYKCKECGNEVVAFLTPYDCDVCGERKWKVLAESINLENKTAKKSLNFTSTITNYCLSLGWKLYDINEELAIIKFDMDSGTTQTLFIINYDSILEFSCPSNLRFKELDDIPHRLSTYLLQENKKYKYGFWCIEKISEKHVFSIIHNVPLSSLDLDYFRNLVVFLIQKCDDFEQAIEELIKTEKEEELFDFAEMSFDDDDFDLDSLLA
jgi:hypothetical protein